LRRARRWRQPVYGIAAALIRLALARVGGNTAAFQTGDAMAKTLLGAIVLIACSSLAAAADAEWHSLFDGKDLDGWTPKIARHAVGENYANTFRVEDGVIKVSYDQYGKFDRQFGHLFTNQAYSNYILRLEYKFVGSAVEDSPPWAKLNSGVMIHSQSPLSMTRDQEFPTSMEFQFLATGATAGKQTGNVCTPGTNVEMGGKLLLDHIIDAKSKFYPLDEWVSVEAEVRGNKEVIYRVNGTEVLRYQRPQLDPRDEYAQALLATGSPMQLSFGHIALQAESQPVWFRNIRIKQLDE
jgi:3-keto-disaccharide hydrolase